MIASEIFKDKKDNYPQSVPKLFVNTRLSKTHFPSQLFLLCAFKSFDIFAPDQMERTSTQR